MSRQKPEVIIEDGEGNEIGCGTLAGRIGDHVFIHLDSEESNE